MAFIPVKNVDPCANVLSDLNYGPTMETSAKYAKDQAVLHRAFMYSHQLMWPFNKLGETRQERWNRSVSGNYLDYSKQMERCEAGKRNERGCAKMQAECAKMQAEYARFDDEVVQCMRSSSYLEIPK